MPVLVPWTTERRDALPSLRQSPRWLGVPVDITPFTVVIAAIFGVIACGVATGLGGLEGLVTGAGVILAIFAAMTILRYPTLGGYLAVAIVPISSGLRRGFPVPGLRLSEAVVVATTVLVLVPAFRRATSRWGVVDWAAFVYAVLSFVLPTYHLAARGEAVTLDAVSSTLLPLQFFFLYRTVRTALPERPQRELALRLFLYASLIVAALCVVQQFDIGPARDIIYSITQAGALESYGYSVYARATGPFQHWHPLAGYLTVILLVCTALLLDRRQTVMSRKWLWIVLAGAGVSMMLSITFVSMIGVVLGVALLGLRAGRLGQSLKYVVGGGVVAMLLFGGFVIDRLRRQYSDGIGAGQSWVPQTIQYRIDAWADQYLPGLEGRWLSGFGPDLPPEAFWQHTESLYITLALRGGIPLIAAFAVSMIAVSWLAKKFESDEERLPLGRALWALVGVAWVMNLLFPYFTASGMPQPFWVLAGIAMAGWQTNRSSSRHRREYDALQPAP